MSSSGEGRPAGAGSLALGAGKVEIWVRGMTCASCAASVEKKLSAIGNVVATVNLATEKATVYAPDGVPVQRLVAAVEQAGYGAEVAGPVALGGAGGLGSAGASAGDADAAAYLRRRLVVAVALLVPLSDLSVLLSLFPADRFAGWQWALIALTAPVAGWAAWPFHLTWAKIVP